MTRLISSVVIAAALTVPLVLLADGNYYVLLAGSTLILALMAALGADRCLDGRRDTRLR